MSLMFAATYPERVTSIVVFGLVAWLPDEPSFMDLSQRSLDGISNVADHWGRGELLTFMAPGLPQTELGRRLTGVFERAAASPAMARAQVDAIRLLDVSSVLRAVTQPTLVLQRTDDVVVPTELVREIVRSRLPNARLVELPGTDHWWWVGRADLVLDEIEEFLTGSRDRGHGNRILATVVFTDIVGSTSRAAQLGDARWREVLERHEALVRRQLERYRGRAIKTMGDGFLATFDGPARALECSQAILRDAEEIGVQVRAGVHTGECEVMGDDLGGMAVNIGARIGALAQPGEVLLSSTVKDLVVGSGLRFAPRGVHGLKGVPGEWPLYALASNDAPEAETDGLPEWIDHMPGPRWQRGLAVAAQRNPRLTSMLIARSRRHPRRRSPREM